MAFRSAGYWDVEGTFEAKGVTFGATLTSRRREAPGHREGLRGHHRPAQRGGRRHGRPPRRGGRPGARRAARRRRLLRRLGRVPGLEAVAPPPVHDLHPPAGGRPQAPLRRRAHHAPGPEALRGGLHHLHADRLRRAVGAGRRRRPGRDRRALRRRPPPRQGPGPTPARSRTPRRPTRPSGPPATASAARRTSPGEVDSDEARLYDLIWKRCVASQMADARGRRVSAPADRRRPRRAGGGRSLFSASGKTITFPGFLRAYVEGSDDPDAELEDRETRLPALDQGEAVGQPGAGGRRARHPAAGPLHRGLAGGRAGVPGDRPAVDLRQRHPDHPGPRLRLEEGLGARPELDGLRRGPAARGALHPPGRLRLHGPHGGEPRRHRPGRAGVRPLAAAVLLRQRCRRPADDGRAARPRTSTPGRSTPSPSGSTPRAGRSSSGSAATGRTCPGGRPDVARPRRDRPRRAHPGDGHRAAREGPGRGPGAGRRPGQRPRGHRPGRALRPLRPARRAGGGLEEEAEAGQPVQDDDPRHGHPGRGPDAAQPAPGGRPGRRGHATSWPAPAGSGPTSSGARTPAA